MHDVAAMVAKPAIVYRGEIRRKRSAALVLASPPGYA